MTFMTDISSGLIVQLSSGSMANFYMCPYRDCKGKHWDTVRTVVHADDLGWVFTKDRKFCPPGDDGVFVCPTCAAQYEWK